MDADAVLQVKVWLVGISPMVWRETVQNLGVLSALSPGESTGHRAGKARCLGLP